MNRSRRATYRDCWRTLKNRRHSVRLKQGGEMKESVEVIARALADSPDEVVVTESIKGENTLIEPRVPPVDMGKVTGEQGRIAKTIRSVVKAAASKEDKKIIVEIQ